MTTDMLILILGTFSKEKKNQTCSKDTQKIVIFVIVVVIVVFFIVLKNMTQTETSMQEM